MNPFQNFLEKFSKILATPQAQKKPFIEAVQKIVGLTLTEQDLEVKDGIVYLRVSPAVKNELFMRKKKLLEHVVAQGASLRDIR